MSKSSSQILKALLVVVTVGVILPSRLSAQQSLPSEPSIPDRPAPGAPVELAALSSEPGFSAAKGSATSGATALAFAPVAEVAPAAKIGSEHRFWDRENRALFAVAGGLAVADFCATRANLASGGKELNPVTRMLSSSTPGLAANFALETGGLISVSYLLHKTGHHKLERMASYLNISSSAGAVAWDLSHR